MSETLAWILGVLLWLLPLGLWCAWWLCCVNWARVWPVLSRGGWIGVVLLMFIIALPWSRFTLNFWGTFGHVGAWAALALFCGWLQGQLGWTPPEMSFAPPAHHDHGHGHGHH